MFITTVEAHRSDNDLLARFADLTSGQRARLVLLLQKDQAKAHRKRPGRRSGTIGSNPSEIEINRHFIRHLHQVILAALEEAIEGRSAEVPVTIARALERPIMIEGGPLVGCSVSGLAHNDRDIALAIRTACGRGLRTDLLKAIRLKRKRRALANAIVLEILHMREKGISEDYLLRILRNHRKPTASISAT